MLSNSEIERLRRGKKEINDYARKAFRDRSPVEPDVLTQSEVEELRRNAKKTGEYAREAFKKKPPL